MFTRAHRLGTIGIVMALALGALAMAPTLANAAPSSSLTGSPYNGTDGIADVASSPDATGSGDGTNYGGGAKEDSTCPAVTTGTASPKDDLDAFYFASQATTSGVFAYLGWHRVDVSGTTTAEFELNQETGLASGCTNGVSTARTTGDLLVTYDFHGTGPFLPDISLRKWTGAEWGTPTTLPASSFEGSLNADSSFGELVINLTAAGIFNPDVCENLASVFVKTRSSSKSFESEIKDFVLPVPAHASNCGSITLHKVDDAQPAAVMQGVVFTLYAANDDGSQGPAVVPTKSCTTDASGDCTILNIFPGQYWVAETGVPAGYTASDPRAVTVGLAANRPANPITVVNPRKPVHISLHKIDDAGHSVAGAQFGLFGSGPAAIASCTTDAGGNCLITATVSPGTYTLTETLTPDGYATAPSRTLSLVPGQTISADGGPVFTDVRKPSSIALDKKVNGQDTSAGQPLDVETGSLLTYTVTVTNTGQLPLTISDLSDSLHDNLPADCSPSLQSGLAPAGVISCLYTTTATDPGPPGSIVHNTASVTGSDQFGRTRSASDETFVHVLDPKISIVKTGPTTVHVGDTIAYTLTVTNPGNTPLADITVTDPKCDAAPTLTLKQGSDNLLNPGETWTYSCSHVAVPGDGPSLLNSAVASGTDSLGTSVRSTGQATTAIIAPKISLDKVGPARAHVGDTLTYTLTVGNPGTTPLVNVAVTDPKCDAAPVRTSRQGEDEVLDPGETWIYSCSHVVLDSDGASVANVAHASGVDLLQETVRDDGEATTSILRPEIGLAKAAPAAAHVGDTLPYTLTVTNPGTAPLRNITVLDPVCDSAPSLASKQGEDNWLDPGETWVYQCSHTVAAADGNQVVNGATVSGSDALEGTVDSAASATTDILKPAIGLDKTGPAAAHVGDSIAYTLTVTNLGNTGLSSIEVTDAKCDAAPTLVTRQGSDNVLDPGEMWTYSCRHAVFGADGQSILNTASASGTDRLEKTVTDTGEARTAVLMPAIGIVKTGPDTVHVGDPAVFTLTVTNPGNTPLAGVTVTDPKCDTPPVRATADSDGILSPGETWIYHCTHVAGAGDGTSIFNTGTAGGTDTLGSTVTNTSSHTTAIAHPGISLTKTSDPKSVSGPSGTVTYTYVVTNTGNTALFGVLVTDDVLGPIGRLSSLQPGESATLAKTVTVTLATPLTNIGTAAGTDALGQTVSATATATLSFVLAEVLVQPAQELPRTGAPIRAELYEALALLGVGLVLSFAGRRRRRAYRPSV